MAKEPSFDRKAFEFRKLLGKISDGLGVENVRALKNLCYDVLPERKREEINTGIELFNVLIEQSESARSCGGWVGGGHRTINTG